MFKNGVRVRGQGAAPSLARGGGGGVSTKEAMVFDLDKVCTTSAVWRAGLGEIQIGPAS